ncbi:MAG TPA: phospholipase D-like domain-containing protein [Vicinamibacterales bacterium]
MSDPAGFTSTKTQSGLHVKLWRGERMCLVGMDVDDPEPDFVGFAIEVKAPGTAGFTPLRNRLNFQYGTQAVSDLHVYPSTDAPFQRFRWVHFPQDLADGTYAYRVTKKHMRPDGTLTSGTSLALNLSLDRVIYDDYLDIGFTRNFASSQAYAEKYGNNPNVIPAKASAGLKFQKLPGDVYQWLGFEASQLIFDFLDAAAKDPAVELDMFAYDFNEPDILKRLVALGPRVRAIIDNSGSHAPSTSAESQAARALAASAGKDHVQRMHFKSLQHNKVLIAKRGGAPFKVLLGSTNFSFRGLYIQANNALVFSAPEAAALFEQAFTVAFTTPAAFSANPIAQAWHLVQPEGKPAAHFCFSPHAQPNLSLNPLAGAMDQATSSVFFSIAFLAQDKSGPTREAIDRLMKKNVFSYGIADRKGGLQVSKPDGSIGIVDFEYLAKDTPEPFRSEWSGGAGIHEHHKFVVTDFSLPTAKVFSGSSNLSTSGEKGNGDHIVMIEDQRVATSYAIEALRLFDHFHFRSLLQDAQTAGAKTTAKKGPAILTLGKPASLSGQPAWFEAYYKAGSQKQNDRELFSR